MVYWEDCQLFWSSLLWIAITQHKPRLSFKKKMPCGKVTWPHPYMQFQRIGHDHHEGTSFEGTSYSSWFFLQSTSYSYPDDNNHNKSLVQTSRLFVTRYQRLIPKAVQEKAISASSPSQLPDPMDFDMTNALQLFMLKTHSCLTSKRSHFQTPTKKNSLPRNVRS